MNELEKMAKVFQKVKDNYSPYMDEVVRVSNLPTIQFNEEHCWSLKEIYRNENNEIVYVIFTGGNLFYAHENAEWKLFLKAKAFTPLPKQEIEKQIALAKLRRKK